MSNGLTPRTETPVEMKLETPREIVAQLDRYIVGQLDAKRAVAIAIRNRWRRQQLEEEMKHEISPKNILMIGPTGVGKTEIARRLAKLTGAPFIKVEATKYTEVGYYGRDVESMVRELIENSIGIVRDRERKNIEEEAKDRTNEKLLDLIIPRPVQHFDFPLTTEDNSEFTNTEDASEDPAQQQQRYDRTRAKFSGMLMAGELENRKVELTVETRGAPVVFSGTGMENMDMDLQGMFEKIMPKSSSNREVTVSEARKIIFEQECEGLLDNEQINANAIELAENLGIIFLDEIDKVIASESKGGDVSRQGVQRDLLPIVEGTTIQTKYGYVRTDYI
ncbi:MAG: ATP-dependent protease ATPase subunit HslU, partial [Planctomycetota bacterium]|nr:ATP-dependent protease ATPase subunit HslU [Planctomycetota bacterium]